VCHNYSYPPQIDDAKVAMLLYRHSKDEWEQLVTKKEGAMKFVDKKRRKNRSLGALPTKKRKMKEKLRSIQKDKASKATKATKPKPKSKMN